MSDANNQSRRKIVRLAQDRVLAIMTQAWLKHDFIIVPKPLGLPEGYTVVGVWNDWQRNSFDFLIQHHSFDPVPMGAMAPEIKIEWRAVEVSVKP